MPTAPATTAEAVAIVVAGLGWLATTAGRHTPDVCRRSDHDEDRRNPAEARAIAAEWACSRADMLRGAPSLTKAMAPVANAPT